MVCRAAAGRGGGMGSESSALKRYTPKGPAVTLPAGLAVHPAQLQDGRAASVFLYRRQNEERVHEAAKLKTLRHPNLLRFLSCAVEPDGVRLLTERVRPLQTALDTLAPAEVCAGIYDVLQALIFLHDRGQLTHNNVCLDSVFVSEDGHWKLGGMDTVCAFPQATPEFLRSIQPLRDPASVPPEETAPDFSTLPAAHGHARDAYSFGRMVEALLAHLGEQPEVRDSPQQPLASALLHPSPQARPPLRTLLAHDFFRNHFLEVVNFLRSLTLKSEEEKAAFFERLLDKVSCLSEELIATRLVPLLLNQLVFAEPVAVTSFLPHLLGPRNAGCPEEASRLLSPALFQARVVPALLQLFQVHEEHVRLVLLRHLEAYVGHFSPEQLRSLILPQVLLGLRDTSPAIVTVTLRSLAVLVSLLGPEVVVGGQRRKIFKRSAPSFSRARDLSPPGDSTPQPTQLPVNGVASTRSNSGGEDSSPPNTRTPEDWPDWGEPEEPAESVHARPTELPSLDATEPNRDPRPGSLVGSRDSGVVSGEQGVGPAPPLRTLSPPEPTQAAQHERRLQPSGLGEEFAIQVKKALAEPEQDWFADMVPEIKPSAVGLLLPKPGTGGQGQAWDPLPPGPLLPSKFAAAEMPEGEAEGWGEEGELAWEDTSW